MCASKREISVMTETLAGNNLEGSVSGLTVGVRQSHRNQVRIIRRINSDVRHHVIITRNDAVKVLL